jgi:hypothetical protein
MKKFLYRGLPFVAWCAPMVVLAQGNADFSYLTTVLFEVREIIDAAIPFVVGLAVVIFIYTLIRYMNAGGDADKRAEARGIMIWGIVILFVMVSVWGLVRLLGNITNVAPGGAIDRLPGLPS